MILLENKGPWTVYPTALWWVRFSGPQATTYTILGFACNCLDTYDRRQLSPLIDLTYHSVFKASWFRIVATIRAPWLGGLDHMGRMIALSWLRIFSAVSLSVVTTQRLPHLSSAIYKKYILVAHNLACVQDDGISGLAKEKRVVGKIDLGLNQYLA